jgi:hypothetical protein
MTKEYTETNMLNAFLAGCRHERSESKDRRPYVFKKWLLEYNETLLSFSKIANVRNMIMEKHKVAEKDIEDSMICPECGKVLSYRISSLNGHIWGKCETDKCICWME